jgi:hypothetical protein
VCWGEIKRRGRSQHFHLSEIREGCCACLPGCLVLLLGAAATPGMWLAATLPAGGGWQPHHMPAGDATRHAGGAAGGRTAAAAAAAAATAETSPERLRRVRSEIWRNGLAGSIAISVAVGTFNPLDTLRIRWQVLPRPSGHSHSHGGGGAGHPAAGGGIRAYGMQIVRTEGLVRGLWTAGIGANMASFFVCGGIRQGVRADDVLMMTMTMTMIMIMIIMMTMMTMMMTMCCAGVAATCETDRGPHHHAAVPVLPRLPQRAVRGGGGGEERAHDDGRGAGRGLASLLVLHALLPAQDAHAGGGGADRPHDGAPHHGRQGGGAPPTD